LDSSTPPPLRLLSLSKGEVLLKVDEKGEIKNIEREVMLKVLTA